MLGRTTRKGVRSFTSSMDVTLEQLFTQAVVLTHLLWLTTSFSVVTEAKDFCHNEEFTAECTREDDVILMTSALYGRMTKGRCVTTDFGFIGCHSDVITHAHEQCSGQRACQIRVPDTILDRSRPCNEDLKSYLEANFTCVRVARPVSDACDLLALTEPSHGYIISRYDVNSPSPTFLTRDLDLLQHNDVDDDIVAHHRDALHELRVAKRDAMRERAVASSGVNSEFPATALSLRSFPTTACGTDARPWIIQVLPGQRVNVTLFDFSSLASSIEESATGSEMTTPETSYKSLDYRQHSNAVGQPTSTARPTTSTTTTTTRSSIMIPVPPGTCDQYAMFIEHTGHKAYLCGTGSVVTSHAHTSLRNTLKVIVFYREIDNDRYNFLLKYEAVGCPDVGHTPSNVWFRRDGDLMTVGCVNSDLTWVHVCNGTRWDGPVANCSVAGSKDARREDGLPTLSIGASILIILAVSLAIGLIVLLFGLVYMKRRRSSDASQSQGVRSVELHDMKMPRFVPPTYDASTAAIYSRSDAFDAPSTTFKVSVTRERKKRKSGTGAGTCSRGLSAVTTADAAITSAAGAILDENNEYEYVWDMPSTLLHQIKTAERPDLVQLDTETLELTGGINTSRGGEGVRGATGRGIIKNSDPVNISSGAASRDQCSCLRATQTISRKAPQPQLLLLNDDMSAAAATAAAVSAAERNEPGPARAPMARFRGLTGRSRPTELDSTLTTSAEPLLSDRGLNDEGRGIGGGGVGTGDLRRTEGPCRQSRLPQPGSKGCGSQGLIDVRRTCHQCGHLIADYSLRTAGRSTASAADPTPGGTGPLMRRIPLEPPVSSCRRTQDVTSTGVHGAGSNQPCNAADMTSVDRAKVVGGTGDMTCRTCNVSFMTSSACHAQPVVMSSFRPLEPGHLQRR